MAASDIRETSMLKEHGRVLETLLRDRSTGRNIMWGTDSYASLGEGYAVEDEITIPKITGHNEGVIRPRALKSKEEQGRRVRVMAEVFTPSWICGEMNDAIDKEAPGEWQDYISATVLEVTCGEAPFLASRYDTVTGEPVPIEERAGILDRKLRKAAENASGEDYVKWALAALGSVYGYEWQGDNLLLAREALLATFGDYYRQKTGNNPDEALLLKAAEIISWNIWQMDGLKGVVPGTCHSETETDLFGGTAASVPCPGCASGDILLHNGLRPRLRRWVSSPDGQAPDFFEFSYLDILTGKTNTFRKTRYNMKFDFVIGNPPYQDMTESDSTRMPPVYNLFMEEAYKLSDKVELITPARFLFNAGYTPRAWNKKMLSDPHFKVLKYEQKSDKVFQNTDIKGGIAISYRDATKDFGAIETFTVFPELNSMLNKVLKSNGFRSLSDIIAPALSFGLADKMLQEHPNTIGRLRTSGFTTLSEIFFEEKPDDGHDYVKFLGILNGKRTYRYVRRDYISDKHHRLDAFKVILPASNGSGAIGEVLSTPLVGEPLVGEPLVGYMQSFISIGAFDNRAEAEACLKYIKSKFARTMLGILKITQHNPPEKWKYVPLQDFTSASDIDWTQSVRDIDLQLYRKYRLTADEISFVERMVKPME